ncbi:MAG: hypothetical protein LBV17_09030 [Treponema sp.]|nr:hypothetical protein [Treponema sp.]
MSREIQENREERKEKRTIPLPPYLAKVMKEKVGMEFFTRYNWNLSEVEAEFGPDYISK